MTTIRTINPVTEQAAFCKLLTDLNVYALQKVVDTVDGGRWSWLPMDQRLDRLVRAKVRIVERMEHEKGRTI